MTDRPYPSFAILLIGICACLPEHPEPVHERFAAIDIDEADFNGDGHADLAIGVEHDFSSGVRVGGVNVLYGSANGLTAIGNQLWNQDSPGIQGVAHEDEYFGKALAIGNFNGDGYTDLAIGAPFDSIDSVSNVGTVTVLYGSATGLMATGNQLWHQNSPGIQGMAESEEFFASVLTSGDFDGDGHDDLAIGVPYDDDPHGFTSGGLVHIIRGSSAGLTAVGNQLWHQDALDVEGIVETAEFFGSSLAAGDFDRDGHDDLAIGVPGEDHGNLLDAGWVHVLYGSNSGLSGSGDELWHQNTEGIEGVAETEDRFGQALATGDFDNDGFDDLVVGVPAETVGSLAWAGAVNTIYGSSSGLTAFGNQYWYQDQPGVEGVSESHDSFGAALVAGDFDGDGRDDLAVAAPGETLGNIISAGSVNVLYGSSSGLSSIGTQLWHQKIFGIEGVAEHLDGFGSSLSAGDFDQDGAADLAIGVKYDTPLDIQNVVKDTGAVNVIYGSGTGLDQSGNQLWHQDSPDVLGVAESHEFFGRVVR